MLRWPVDPMRAAGTPELPTTPGLIYQMKWDGFRCIAWRTTDGVRLQSRHGTDLTRFLPDLAAALAWLPPRVVLDGEVLVWDDRRGRTSFTLLQSRLTAGRRIKLEAAAHPAHFVAFDLLRDRRGVELLDLPLLERRRKLDRLTAGAPPELTLCRQTDNPAVAAGWMAELGVAGIEGVVSKPASGRYVPGLAGWSKTRTRQTAEYVIGGVTGSPSCPSSLLLGRYDYRGVLRFVAQTHPLKADQRRELGPALRVPVFRGGGHPWPCPLPGGWTVDLTSREPLPYVPVEPDLVAEVVVDNALDGPFGKARHRVQHVRLRLDLRARDVVLALDFAAR